MSAIDPARARLEEFRAWVQIRLETREDPPPIWYRYYRLRQDLDALLTADILLAVPIDPPRCQHPTDPICDLSSTMMTAIRADRPGRNRSALHRIEQE